MQLLDKAGLTKDDKSIAVGDIPDRWPDSPRVVESFRDRPGAMSLMGNHDAYGKTIILQHNYFRPRMSSRGPEVSDAIW
ncbi:MAG: hypothetical protein ACOC6C_01610 [Verrucomicrobiota bacterium]